MSLEPKRQIADYLNSNDQRCIVFFDSIESHPIQNPILPKVIAGLLMAINRFRVGGIIGVNLCIPEEYSDVFEENLSNSLKDLEHAVTLKWTPGDLLQIVAHRFFQYIDIHQSEEDATFIERFEGRDWSVRANIQEFFDATMAEELINSHGQPENSLGYMIRHTHLLPREFLVLFTDAIKFSRDEIGEGSKKWITADAVVKSVTANEGQIATHNSTLHKRRFPRFLTALDDIMPNMDSIVDIAKLRSLETQFKGRYEDEITDVWRTLYAMGALGYADEILQKKSEESDRYFYADFYFTTPNSINFRKGMLYCVHPLFSRKWNMKKPKKYETRFVYPANIESFFINEKSNST